MVGSRAGNSAGKPLEQLSDEEFWQYARKMARMVPVAAHPGEYLECSLEHGCFLIPLTALHEVAPSPHHFACLPAIPTWMLGLIAWRGEAIAAIDLDAYLFAPAGAVPARTPRQELQAEEGALLVADYKGQAIGLCVPAIGSITAPDYAPLTPSTEIPPSLTARRHLLKGQHDHSFVLEVPALLEDVVRQIEMAATYG